MSHKILSMHLEIFHSVSREIEATFTSVLSEVYPLSHCLCPGTAPAVSTTDSHHCISNSDGGLQPRFEENLFAADLVTDGRLGMGWVGSPGYDTPIIIEIDLGEQLSVSSFKTVIKDRKSTISSQTSTVVAT